MNYCYFSNNIGLIFEIANNIGKIIGNSNNTNNIAKNSNNTNNTTNIYEITIIPISPIILVILAKIIGSLTPKNK